MKLTSAVICSINSSMLQIDHRTVVCDVPAERRTPTDPPGRGSGSPFRSQRTAQRTARCSSRWTRCALRATCTTNSVSQQSVRAAVWADGELRSSASGVNMKWTMGHISTNISSHIFRHAALLVTHNLVISQHVFASQIPNECLTDKIMIIFFHMLWMMKSSFHCRYSNMS